MTNQEVDVLVVGAGPTGLTAANEAVRHGLTVRIVDRKENRSTFSKALVVHARTLETFEAMGLVASILEAGVPFSAMRILPGDKQEPVRVDLMELDWGDTRYPYWLSIPQFATERCLEEALAEQGVAVDWNTSFLSLLTDGDLIQATVEGPDGTEESIRAKWVIGCDGGGSPVRKQAGIGFDSKSIGETFIIADALGDAPMPEDEGTTSLSSQGVLFLVPMPEAKRWRVIAHQPGAEVDSPITIDADYLNRLISERLGFDFGASDISWTSQFVLKQGVASDYRNNQVFIAGDAAHLHSPVGGQGLNTGVQDAYALLWRIALAERVKPRHDALLDSYEIERGTVAQSMVKNTTRATNLFTLHRGALVKLRGLLAKPALKTRLVRNQLSRNIGMLDLAYKTSAIIGPGTRGELVPGGRLPNPKFGTDCMHDALHDRRHTVLVLDTQAAELVNNLRAEGIAVVEIDDPSLKAQWGAALVIVRPDRVIATASATADQTLVDTYAQETLGVPLSSL